MNKNTFKQSTNKSTKISEFNKAFTLLEVMVAVTIFSILSLFVLNMYVTISRLYLANYSVRSAQQNVRNVVEIIGRYVKQARVIEKVTQPNNTNGELQLLMRDDSGTDYRIWFKRDCMSDPYPGRGFNCSGRDTLGVINVAEAEGTGAIPNDYQALTSQDLHITQLKFEVSPGVPLVLKITVGAQMEERERSWERGISGTGEIVMSTSVILRGQYF